MHDARSHENAFNSRASISEGMSSDASPLSGLPLEPGVNSACNFLIHQAFAVHDDHATVRKSCSLPARYKYHEWGETGSDLPPCNGNFEMLDPFPKTCVNASIVANGKLRDYEMKKKIPPPEFKMKLDCMKHWFSEFDNEQKNLMIKALLEDCGTVQNHFLSVIMEKKGHQTCPPNCQDLLSWLPTHLSLYIFSFLDAVSLAKVSRVCRSWYILANEPSLWQQFCRDTKWQLSPRGEKKFLAACTLPDKAVDWKRNFIDRFRLRRNWLKGYYHVRTFEGHSQGISCVQFDDNRIVSGSSDKTIKVWNIRTNSPWSVMTLVGHSGTVRCLHLEENRLVSGSTDRTIKVWDLSTQESWSSIACKVTMIGHTHTVRCLQVDDQKVVSGSYDKNIKVWDLKTGKCSMTLRGHEGAVLCLQFNKVKLVSGSSDKTLKIWNLHTGVCLTTLHGHQDAVTCLQFDETRIFTGSLDRMIKLWNIFTGECVRTLDWMHSEGHTGVIRCLQADSWRFISGGDDKTLKVWSLETGQRLVTLQNHADGITCLQFNDSIIVSGSYDKTVKLWDFSVC